MKKTIVWAALALAVLPLGAKKKQEVKNDSLIFTTIIENPVTSIKNQNNSGTCWSYSSLAFLESEENRKKINAPEGILEKVYAYREKWGAK